MFVYTAQRSKYQALQLQRTPLRGFKLHFVLVGGELFTHDLEPVWLLLSQSPPSPLLWSLCNKKDSIINTPAQVIEVHCVLLTMVSSFQ